MKKLKSMLAATGLLMSSFSWFAAVPVRAAAATCTWDGDTNSKMSDAANWSCAGGPVDGDDLVFPVTAVNTDVNNDKSGFKPRSIKITGSGGTAYLIYGNPMEISSGIVLDATGGTSLTHVITNNLTLSGVQDFILGDNNLTIGKLDETSTFAMSTFGINSITGTGVFKIRSVISGSGTINSSVNEFRLLAANTYAGTTNVTAGYLVLEDKDALGNTTGKTTIGDGASLILDAGLTTTDLTVPESISFEGVGAGGAADKEKIILSGGTSTNAVKSGPYYILSGALNFASDVEVENNTGPRTDLKLTGALTGTGKKITPVKGRDLEVWVAGSTNTTGTANAKYRSEPIIKYLTDTEIYTANSFYAAIAGEGITAGNITVNQYGYLKGKGTVANVTVNEGTIAPGLSPGCLTSTGTVSYTGGSLDVEINGTTACTGYDQLVIETTGSIDLGSSPDQATLKISRTGFTPAVGNKFTIVNNKSADEVTGTFDTLNEGSTVKVDGVTYSISYVGGDGNDVVLTVTAVDAAAPTTTSGTTTATTPGTPNTGITPVKIFTNLLLITLIGVAISWALVNNSKRSTVKSKK